MKPSLWGLLPLGIASLVFLGIPLLDIVSLAFHNQAGQWVGILTLQQALGDPAFSHAILTTLTMAVLSTAIALGLGIGLGSMMAKNQRGLTLLLLPLTVSPWLGSLLWKNLYTALPFSLLSQPLWALGSVIMVDVWQWTPLVILVVITGLIQQAVEIREAAALDGASPRQVWRWIRWPLLLPLVVVVGSLRFLGSLALFEPVYILTGGGPGTSTETVSTYLFQIGLGFGDYPTAAALALPIVTTGIIVIIGISQVLSSDES